MKKNFEFTCLSELRLDRLIAEEFTQISRSQIQGLIVAGNVHVNGKAVLKSLKPKLGDKVTVIVPEPEPVDIAAENIPLEIVYEDEHLMVVNKPKGMVVHPAPGNYTGTMVNALLFHAGATLSGINGKIRPGIVHRIDKDTSGLLIVAKNDIAHNSLALQIKEHSLKREYRAVVYGNLKNEKGIIEAPIGRNPKDRKQMAVVYNKETARNAVTHYNVLQRFKGFTYVVARLETGRTHQIRVHMASIGHPVAGDAVYGPKKVITELGGQCLHAGVIGFIHPVSGCYMQFEAELPQCFQKYLKKLEGGI